MRHTSKVCRISCFSLQALYDALGADQLMFGSDGGSFHPAVVANYLRRVRALRAPAQDVEKILGLNAARFLGIDA